MEEIKVRENLNDMVKKIELKRISNKYGDRDICKVTLFNNEVIEFKDKDGLYDLIASYKKCGITDAVVSCRLVEEVKTDDVGEQLSKFVCVAYTLKDGSIYRMFVSKFASLKIIDNYWGLFVSQNA